MHISRQYRYQRPLQGLYMLYCSKTFNRTSRACLRPAALGHLTGLHLSIGVIPHQVLSLFTIKKEKLTATGSQKDPDFDPGQDLVESSSQFFCDMIGRTGLVDSFNVSLSFVRKKHEASSMKLALSETLKFNIPVYQSCHCFINSPLD